MREFGEWVNGMANSVEDCSGNVIYNDVVPTQQDRIKVAYNETLEELGRPEGSRDCIEFYDIMFTKLIGMLLDEQYDDAEGEEEHLKWFEDMTKSVLGE